MKKPIDPNLESLNDSLPIEVEDLALFNGIEDDSFNVKHAAHSSRRSDYHASSHHSGEHHHHHHHSSGSHHSSSGKHKHKHSGSKHHHHSSKKKKLPTAVKVIIIIVAILLALIISAASAFLVLEHKGKQSLTAPTVTTQENFEETITYKNHKYVYNKDVVAFAFIGVDKRELGLDNGIVGTAGQADADLVFTIDTKTARAKVIAIPRDTMVEVDLYDKDGAFLRNEEMQLCLSYAYGNGKETSAENVTKSLSRILYNVPINKYFALDLNGIAPINDAIGGVTVTSLYNFGDDVGIKEGDEVHLVGDLAEIYVRRRNLTSTDESLNRTARQVQYVKAFASQLAPAVVKDFSIISSLYNTTNEYSTKNITLSDATYMASILLSKGVMNFEATTIQGTMKQSDRLENADVVFAEFYPDEDNVMETVLDTFYTQID